MKSREDTCIVKKKMNVNSQQVYVQWNITNRSFFNDKQQNEIAGSSGLDLLS